jgi:hypothetical protein
MAFVRCRESVTVTEIVAAHDITAFQLISEQPPAASSFTSRLDVRFGNAIIHWKLCYTATQCEHEDIGTSDNLSSLVQYIALLFYDTENLVDLKTRTNFTFVLMARDGDDETVVLKRTGSSFYRIMNDAIAIERCIASKNRDGAASTPIQSVKKRLTFFQ